MSQPLSIVKPLYNTDREALTFLIVCESDAERKSLGEAMETGCKGKPYRIHVLTRKCLPLSKRRQEEKEHFDFLVFAIDPKEEKSLKNIIDSLQFVDVEYFPGKCCFLMLNDKENNLAPEIQKFVNFYATEALCANFSNEKEMQDMVSKILIKAELSCGLDCFPQT